MPEFVRRTPDGDTRERLICAACGHVAYENPKVVVGAVVSEQSRVLLCRRAIEPRRGFWTLPAGFLELGETLEEGARREVLEEAGAEITIDGIVGVFSLSRIGQIHLFFRARACTARGLWAAPGAETAELGCFEWEAIPWSDIAFPSVRWALAAWHRGQGSPLGPPAGNPPEDARGTGRLPPRGQSA